MYIVKISTDKLSNMAENAEKMLRYGGKLMQCLDELQREGGEDMGERYGMRRGGEDMGERRPIDYRDVYMQRAQWRNGVGQQNYYREDGESRTPMMGERDGFMGYGNRGGR